MNTHRLLQRSLSIAAASMLTFTSCAGPGFGKHAHFVQPDTGASPRSLPPADAVRVTYLGTNSYLLRSRAGTVLIDPYYSRDGSLLALGLYKKFERHPDRVQDVVKRLPNRVDLVLVTHAHFDHLADQPEVARKLHAQTALSPTAKYVALAAGAKAPSLHPMCPNESWTYRGIRVTALAADHGKVLGRDFAQGKLDHVPDPKQLDRIAGWPAGEPLAWLVEINGKRIYIESGSTRVMPPPLGRIDLAIIGVPGPDSVQRYPAVVKQLRPHYVLPSHQDDFGKPLSARFHYLPAADMDRVERLDAEQKLPGKLILLDYFKPWDLR